MPRLVPGRDGDKPDFPLALNELAWIWPRRKMRGYVRARSRATGQTRLRIDAKPAGRPAHNAFSRLSRGWPFPDAIVTVQQAHDVATAAGQTDIAGQDKELLKLYQSGNPYRETH